MTRPLTTLLLGAAMAAFAVAAPAAAQDAKPQAKPAAKMDYVFTEAPDDHALGDKSADHTLIVYASNTCPHCQQWFLEEWPTIKSDLIEPGNLRVIFRPLPSQPAQLSMLGFMIAECAPAEDYFDVIEMQFDRQDEIFAGVENGQLRAEYDAISDKAGLTTDEKKSACMADADKLNKIHLAGDRATAGGVMKIPGFILDGKVMKGDHSSEAIAKALEAG